MRSVTIAVSALLFSIVSAEPGCDVSQAAQEAAGAASPPGQVWLTPAEIAAAKIEVAKASEQLVEDTIVTSGTISLDDLRTGHVFPPVTGRVVKIVADLGQRVKKGDPLATIESPDIGNAVSDVHKAEADLIAAEHDLRRKRDLYAEKAASAAELESSEDAERNAKAELERARQKQFLLRVGNVDTVTQTYTLASPLDGEVLLRNINPGIEVQGQYSGGAGNTCVPGLASTQACGELFTIGELDKVWVLSDLYEVDFARVRVGARARVKSIANPDREPEGVVDWISGSLDPNTRTAKMRCTFDNPEKLLRPMMYSTVQISVNPRQALAIPRSALVRLGEYDVVFIEVGEGDGRRKFERLPVEVAESRSGVYVEVKHGIEPGQNVVVNGAVALSQRL
jgi:cobalt-zinc-cadmium efflux system membrane fusion protein